MNKPDLDYNHLPVWLPKKIEQTGFTTEQIANRVGVSRTMLYEYMTDAARPSEQTMLRLCRVLGVSFEEGLRQYTPKKNGRPRGSGTTSQIHVRKI